jgi:hypothetical protein
VTDRSPGRLMAAPRSALRTGSGASPSTTARCVRLSVLGERLVQATRVCGYESPRARDLGEPTLDSVALAVRTIPAARYRSRCPRRDRLPGTRQAVHTRSARSRASQHSGAVGPEHCFHRAGRSELLDRRRRQTSSVVVEQLLTVRRLMGCPFRHPRPRTSGTLNDGRRHASDSRFRLKPASSSDQT